MYSILLFIVVLSSFAWLYVGLFVSNVHIFLRIVMVIVGTIALVVMPQHDIYFPKWGEAVFPAGVLDITPAQGNVILEIDSLPPNAKVVFWEHGSNGGVSQACARGSAFITLDCHVPSENVSRFGIDKKLPDLIYFRYEVSPGAFSAVQTKNLKESC